MRCPECGSRVFKATGSFKARFYGVFQIRGGRIVQVENISEHEEYRTVNNIWCAVCGADLAKLCSGA